MTLQKGDYIKVTNEYHELFGEELTYIENGYDYAVGGYIRAKDKNENTYALKDGDFVKVDPHQHVYIVDKIESGNKVRVLIDDKNLQQPAYVVLKTEENGLKVMDDRGELAFVSYGNVEKLSPQDALDMIVSLSIQHNNLKYAFNEFLENLKETSVKTLDSNTN